MERCKWLGFIACVCVAAILLSATGCSTTLGRQVPNSQFAYPNSNVTALGPAQGKVVKWSFFVPPDLTVADIRGAYNKALAQQQGANILINFKEDTTFTAFPIIMISAIEYKVDGTAAKMEVGTQTLK